MAKLIRRPGCYKGTVNELKILPLYTSSAVENAKLFSKQRLELRCRGEFVRTYLARDRSHGDRQRLDPVLASHLGLTEALTEPGRKG